MEYIKIRIQIEDKIIRIYVWNMPIIVDFLDSLFCNKRHIEVLNKGLSR